MTIVVHLNWKSLACGLLLWARWAFGGIADYPTLIAADGPGAVPSRNSVRITYLGVNGYQFEAGEHALLIDPYFTRVSLWTVALGRPIQSNPQPVGAALSRLAPHPDAILVTHAHFDHLLDVPEVIRRTGARLVAGPTAVNLAKSVGVPDRRCEVVTPGCVRQLGPWKVSVLAAKHDRVIGSSPPFPGVVTHLSKPPIKASDWVIGEPLAFIIEASGKRIYIESGGRPGDLPPIGSKPVDIAILGVALADSRERFPSIVRHLRPRYVLPSHQDDFFAPIERGFAFGKLTNFPQVKRTFEEQRLPGQLILLDYFRPWTLR